MASAPSGAERKEETMETWREKFRRFLASLGLVTEPGVHYIGGSDVLPPPLSREREAELLARLGEEEARQESGRCLRCDHFGYGNFKGGREEKW